MTVNSHTPFSIDAAYKAIAAGNLLDAEEMARESLQQSHDKAAWTNILGIVCAMTERSIEASIYFRQLVEINPSNSAQWSNLGNALCDALLYDEAIIALKNAISLSENNPYAHFSLARSYRANGNATNAIEEINRALKLEPTDSGFKLLQANLLAWIDDWDGARLSLQQLRGKRLTPEQLTDMANIFLQMNMFDDARSALNSALSFQPENTNALICLGLLEERINSISVAEKCAEKAIAVISKNESLKKKQLPALNQLIARLSFRNKNFQHSADTLIDILSDPPSDPMLHSHLCFELGASLDQLGQFDKAWHAFSKAHTIRSEHLKLSYKGVAGSDLLQIIESDPPQMLHDTISVSADTNKDPIFIAGFPRSGTTLLEQILDSRTGLASFDEQPFLQRLILQLRQEGLCYPKDFSKIDSLLNNKFRKLYFDYVASVAPNLGAGRPVDKNPLNLIRLPFAQGFLPNSKVIIAIRHPCDVVLSCYMQNFRTPLLQTSFSSLETTAELYAKVMSCWQSFRDSLILPTCINRYEDLVTDPIKTTQGLATFLDLQWNESWLDAVGHIKNKGAIRTPSYAQVTEPINQKAKGRWLNYQAYFSTTTLEHLAPWIKEFGYDDVE
jgi:tetratricopeptide (TPR) repeat protein